MSTKISRALSASNIKAYHTTELAANYAQSYYTENGKAVGIWFGKQCAALGIVAGEAATEEEIGRLADGQDPITGEQLIAWKRVGETEPVWVQDQEAWEAHVQGQFEAAYNAGRDVLTAQEAAEPAARSRGAAVEPPATPYTERETKLLEMHAIARQTFVDSLQSEMGDGARAYLKARGIRPKSIEEFGLGLSDDSGRQLTEKLRHYGPELMQASGLFVQRSDGTFYDRFRDRLMFPIENEQGETIAFGGRRAPNETEGPKYINSPETELYRKSETLYNLHRASDRMRNTDQAVLVEGYLDVVAAYQAGQHNVVAPSGTAFTEEQAQLVHERVDTLILSLDPDEAGQRAAEKAVATSVEAGLQPRVVQALDNDPAAWLQNHTDTEFRTAIREAAPLIEYLAQRGKEQFDVTDLYGRVDALKVMVNGLNAVPPEQRQQVSADLRRHLGGVAPEEAKPQQLEHRAGWDIVFSAGKTVSLTALVGGDERLVRWHDEAVNQALAYGERAIQVKMGGTNDPETTAKLVAVQFRHDTARPVDGYAAPQLHTHCVVFNMSQDQHGQFRALNPTELFHLQSAMDAVYQSWIAFRAKAAGYELAHSPHHATELKGYSPEYLEAESQRTVEMQAEKERLQQFGPAADSLIALKTRSAKLEDTPEQIQAAHRAHAEQYGNQPQQVVAAAQEAAQHVHAPSAEQRAASAEKAVEYARTRLSERTAVMEWYEIDRDALHIARGDFTAADVTAAVERAKEQGKFQETYHWRNYAPEARYTTPELQAKEHKILSWMVEGKNRVGAMAGEITKDEFRAHYQGHLNDGQKHLVWNLIHSEDRLVGIQGLAGTGKTTALSVVRQFAADYGFEVRGVAATGGAANELQGAGIAATTLAGFILEQDQGLANAQPRLFLLDEASLADVHVMADFLDRLRPADRAVVIGDLKQHGSVGAGQIFKELQMAGMETYRLHTIVRQQPDSYKAIVKHLARSEINEALEALEARGKIHEQPKEAARHQELAKKFVTDSAHMLGVAPDNRARVAITDEIRLQRAAAGELGAIRYESRWLEPRSELQKEDLKYALHYNPGDVLAYTKANKTGLQRGDLAVVLSVDPDKNELTVMRERDGKVVTYDPSRAGTTVSVYEANYREFAQGDRVQFTKNLKTEKISNRQLGTIVSLSEEGLATIALDNKNPEAPPRQWIGRLDQMPYLDHGYVMTSYSAQGASTDTVLIHLDTDAPHTSRMLTQQLIYVAASRGKFDVHLYTNDVEELRKALYRLEQSPMALPAEEIARYKEGLEMVKKAVGQGQGL